MTLVEAQHLMQGDVFFLSTVKCVAQEIAFSKNGNHVLILFTWPDVDDTPRLAMVPRDKQLTVQE